MDHLSYRNCLHWSLFVDERMNAIIFVFTELPGSPLGSIQIAKNLEHTFLNRNPSHSFAAFGG